jgi:hypothetical protein
MYSWNTIYSDSNLNEMNFAIAQVVIRQSVFDPRLDHVEFIVEKMALEQVFGILRVLYSIFIQQIIPYL